VQVVRQPPHLPPPPVPGVAEERGYVGAEEMDSPCEAVSPVRNGPEVVVVGNLEAAAVARRANRQLSAERTVCRGMGAAAAAGTRASEGASSNGMGLPGFGKGGKESRKVGRKDRALECDSLPFICVYFWFACWCTWMALPGSCFPSRGCRPRCGQTAIWGMRDEHPICFPKDQFLELR
jgi:hypothetical protein